MKRPHRSVHARLWTILAAALPLALFAILTARQTVPVDRPAVLLQPPEQETGQ